MAGVVNSVNGVTKRGSVGEWGLESAEDGLFVESLKWDASSEIVWQLDEHGNKVGAVSAPADITFNMSGEMSSPTAGGITVAAVLDLKSSLPHLVGDTVQGAGVISDNVSIARTRGAFVKIDVSGAYAPFDLGATAAAAAAIKGEEALGA